MVAANDVYELARYDPPSIESGELAEFTLGDGRVRLHQVEISEVTGSHLNIVTRWEQVGDNKTPQDLHSCDRSRRAIVSAVGWFGHKLAGMAERRYTGTSAHNRSA